MVSEVYSDDTFPHAASPVVTALEIAYVKMNDTTKVIFQGHLMELKILLKKKYFLLRRHLRSFLKLNHPPVPRPEQAVNSFFPVTYHLMIQIYRSGRIDDVIEALPTFSDAGIRMLWLSPLHSQSLYTNNDHGYWPEMHSDIDPLIGDELDLKKLIYEAGKLDIQILLDAPINHVGYEAKFHLNGKRISLNDTEIFRDKVANDKKDKFLWAMLNGTKDGAQFDDLQRIIHGRPLWGLPTFRHENKDIRDYLFESYRVFIDWGVTSFRIDAANIIPINFQIEFINRLTEYGERTGRNIFFLLDLWFEDQPLSFFLDRMLPGLLRKNVFIDDTNLTTVLRLAVFKDFSFANLKNLLRSRLNYPELQKLLVFFPESHDYQMTVKDEFGKIFLYLVGDFTSLHPLVLHHGKEDSPDKHISNRDRLSGLKFGSPFFRLFSDARAAVSPFKTVETNYTVEENLQDDVLILKRGNLVLLVSLLSEFTYYSEPGKKITSVATHGSAILKNNSVTLSGKTICLVRVD